MKSAIVYTLIFSMSIILAVFPPHSKEPIKKTAVLGVWGVEETKSLRQQDDTNKPKADDLTLLVNCNANKSVDCLRHKIYLLKQASELLKSRLAQTGNKNGDQQKNGKSNGN